MLKSCILMSWPIDHTQIPGHLYIMRHDSFSVPRVHYTVCICETTVYPQGRTCIATWRTGYVLYRALVSHVNSIKGRKGVEIP